MGKNDAEGSRARASSGPDDAEFDGKTVISSIVSAINQDDCDLVLKAWRRALKATRRQWDFGKKKWKVEPDCRVQLEATKLVTAYKEGLPVQRQITIQGSFVELS